MKRCISFILIIFTILINHNFTYAQEIKLKVAGDKFFPPFEFVDETGRFQGFNVDIMDAISLYTNIHIEYQPMNWSDAVNALENGQIDAIIGMSKSLERQKRFDFSKYTLINSREIFVRSNEYYINSLERLEGKKVAVQSGDISENLVDKFKDIELIREDTQEKALKDLVDGRVDAFIGNKYSGLYAVQKNNYKGEVKITGESVSSNEYCIAMKKGNKKLELINKGIITIKNNNVYDRIYYKWFGQTYTYNDLLLRKIAIIFGITVTSLLFIVGIIVYLNRKLKKMVEHKTEEISENMAKMNCLFLNSPDAIVQFSKDHIILAVNPNFEALFGYSSKECIGQDLDDIITIKSNKEIAKIATMSLFEKENIHFEGWRYTRSGTPIYLNIRAIIMRVNSEVIGGFGIYTDISEINENKKRLEYMSYRDNLTGLYNRRYFEKVANKEFEMGNFPISLIMADLNGLKLVNDALGHIAGDRMLIKFANILKSATDGHHVLARIGGDEFVVFMNNSDKAKAEDTLKLIKEEITSFNEIEENADFTVNASLGYATTQDKSFTIDRALKQADEMMYHDKLLNSLSVRSQILNVLLSALAEKDYVTDGHTKRVKILCSKLGRIFKLGDKEFSDLILLAEMHDLGKVAIEDNILNKSGALTQLEWEKMQQHCEKGYRIALSSPDMTSIADLILKHHERWDGKGYPLGLKGEDTPLLCRILAIADAYDAMTSDRGYNKVKTHEEALIEIENCSGKQFDPLVVKSFLNLYNEAAANVY